jgi:hypothetical protein
MVFNGETNGLLVTHLCDNPACVCPDHLHLGTQPSNGKEASERFAFSHPTNKTWKVTFMTKRMMETLFSFYSLSEIAAELHLPYSTVYYYYRKWFIS